MFYAVILAGGKGERFWPASRALRPKQLLPITSDRSMMEETLIRLAPVVPNERVRVVTGAALAEPIRAALADLAPEHVWVEPEARNTAPPVAFAAAHLHASDPDASMAILPADHYIRDAGAFARALRYADRVARETGALVTFGMPPDRPETGYGYIHAGEKLGEEGPVAHYRAQAFVEKPDLATAEEYLKGGSHLWNSGIFVWRAADILEAFHRHLPEMSAGLEAYGRAVGTKSESGALENLFEASPALSIDYAIMEKADNVVVVRPDMDWDDVGSWSAMDRVFDADSAGNVFRGDVLSVDARECIVIGGDHPVALIGVEGLVVVRTEDATLVCARDRTQDVKAIVGQLKARPNGERYL